ncbi:hypothetical protein PG990_014762 [Apiospora arundinis]
MPARDVLRRRRTRRRDQYNRRRGAHPRPQDDEQQEQPMPPPPPPPLPPPPLLRRHQVINLFVARCLANIRELLKEMNNTMPGASDNLHDWGTEWLGAIPLDNEGHMMWDYDPYAKRRFIELRNHFLWLRDECAFVNNIASGMDRVGPHRVRLQDVGPLWQMIRQLSDSVQHFARGVEQLVARGVKNPKKSTVKLEFVLAGLVFLVLLPVIVEGLRILSVRLLHLLIWFMSPGRGFLLLLFIMFMSGFVIRIWNNVRQSGFQSLRRLFENRTGQI